MQVPYRHVPGRKNERGHLIFLIGFTVGALSAFLSYQLFVRRWDQDVELFRNVHELASTTFFEEVEGEQLVDDALRGMLEGLDRYSRYYGPEEIASLDRETSGEFCGIGVVFRIPTSNGQVLFAFPDSPAAGAGLLVGDTILEIDGRAVAEMQPGELQSTIQRSCERSLPTLVVGLDGAERELVLSPEKVMDPTVRHTRILDAEAGIGYVSILSFSDLTLSEFDAAVAELREQGVRSLILDLRSNPGGILKAAAQVANRFIRSGTIHVTQTRGGTQIEKADPDEAWYADMGLVLLVDGGSASSSEVLAGALQDHGVAPLVGEATFGKGTVQTLTRFGKYRAIAKLTTAHYFTPAMRRIERNGTREDAHGLMPDYLVELGPSERDELHRFLRSYSPPPSVLPALRSWEQSSEAELVPEPPADAQLDAAVSLLMGVPPGSHVCASEE